MLSRPTASNRQPSRDGLPSPPRSAARTNQDAPARSPVPASTFPRHYPCQQRLISPVGSNVSGRFSMAGFEVTLYGRIWVTPKVVEGPPRKGTLQNTRIYPVTRIVGILCLLARAVQ